MLGGNDYQSYTYTYDNAGNRVKLVADGVSDLETVYTYNDANQLLTETTTVGLVDTVTVYDYNDRGSVTEKKVDNVVTDTYTYDARNRLKTYVGAEGSFIYHYRSDDLRYAKINTVTSVSTRYIFDGGTLIYEGFSSNMRLGTVYIYGLNLIASIKRVQYADPCPEELIAFFVQNAHGDIVQLLDPDDNTVTKSYIYDAFGNELDPTVNDTNYLRYCGEYYDYERGEYYLRARNYDPRTGRFTQEDTHWNPGNMIYGDNPSKINARKDPLGLNVYTYFPDINAIMQSGNLYVYCMNSPIIYIDKNGEFVWFAPLIGAAVGALVGGTAQVIRNAINGDVWNEGIGTAMLAGAVSGAIATLPIPGLAGVAGQIVGKAAGKVVADIAAAVIWGGVGNVAGNAIKGDINNINDVLTSFGMGAAMGLLGYGIGQGLLKIADKCWSELGRTAQKQIIKSLGGVKQSMVNVVYQEIKNGVTENIYRQLVEQYGYDVVLATLVSMAGTEVKGK